MNSKLFIKPQPAKLQFLFYKRAYLRTLLKAFEWSSIQGIPAFRDFTIRDPRYFVILFQASISWFWAKKSKKKIFFQKIFGFFFFFFF